MTIDVIIPVYKPDRGLLSLIDKLESQTLPPHRIILINTEQEYFDALMDGKSLLGQYDNLDLFHISRREFDHGGTRNLGVAKGRGEVFICMTQDAVPADAYLIENLIRPLTGKVAVAYGRQLPAEGCGVAERFTREFNYPEQSRIKWAEDIPRLGIKTFFCSNVCAAYRRDIFEELGRFPSPVIFNEDMIFASKAVRAGYGVAYAADARVFHSHNYTGREQFARNFDLGVSQADHPEVFAGVKSESEGWNMVRAALRHLVKTGNGWRIPYFLFQTGCKYMGYLVGRNYRRLPPGLAGRLAMNRSYGFNQERM